MASMIVFPSVDTLSKLAIVVKKGRGVSVRVDSSWCIQEENRLSYTTITFLIESCRDYHFKKDIISLGVYDSVVRALNFDFTKPVIVPQTLEVVYEIKDIGKAAYTTVFEIYSSLPSYELCAKAEIVNVFVANDEIRAIEIPPVVRDRLLSLQ